MRPTCPPTSEPSARRPRALLTVAFANAGANASPEMRERRRAATADPCVLWPLPVPLRSAHGNRTWDWGECQMEVPMQVGVPTHRKLMRENCGVRAAHSARDGARPQPLTLAFWPLPVPLRPAHVGMEHGSRGDCQMDRGTGMELERTNLVYSGARGGFYETMTSARNSRLPATVPVVRRKRDAIGREPSRPHHSRSAPLCAALVSFAASLAP
jgi:hypothetical protein